MKKTTDCKELALKKVNISGNVIGKFGTYEIEQTFVNNTKKVLEVGYTFPITETATVVGFEVIVGDKVMKGQCKEKAEAKEEYQKNIVKGNSAYLLEEESDNIFAITIGKLAKNEEVTVKIKFIDKFEIVDNQIQVLIPTLVPPKYNCKITDKLSYGKVNYTVDFNINVSKNLGISEITSDSHKLNLTEDESNTKIEVLNYDMSKDFKLNIGLKEELSSNALVNKNREGEDILYLSFMPEITDSYEDSEKEYIFLVDISGSMYGDKLEQTKNAVIGCLKQLDEGDRFNIIPFESNFEVMNEKPLQFNETNLRKAIKYTRFLIDKGGTEILEPIKYALGDEQTEKIILLFTDGEVGNEEEIISYVEENIGKSRIFPFGIDTNVNTFFIKELANVGQGKAELIMPGERIDDKIIRTFARIQSPLLEDLTIDYGNNKVIDEIRESNSLFNYEFYNAFVKVENLVDDITLKGHILDNEYSWAIKKENAANTDVDLEVLFAKEEIDRLEDYIRSTRDEEKIENYKKMIVELSEKYNVNSKYTSFLTVYERDNKIMEVPKYQETMLSSKNTLLDNIPNTRFCEFDACFATSSPKSSSIGSKMSGCVNFISNMFSRAEEDCFDDCDYCFSIDTPNVLDDYNYDDDNYEGLTPENISLLREGINKSDPVNDVLKEKVEELMKSERDVLTVALYLLHLLLTENTDKALETIEYLRSRLNEAQQDDDCMKVLLVCYQISENPDIYNMLRDKEKDNNVETHFKRTMTKSQIEKAIKNNTVEENLNQVLLYLNDWRFIEWYWPYTEINIPDFSK